MRRNRAGAEDAAFDVAGDIGVSGGTGAMRASARSATWDARLETRAVQVCALALAVSLAACSSEDGTPTGPEPGDGDVAGFMNELPDWSEFSPLEEPQPATQIGSTEQLPDTTVQVREIQGDSLGEPEDVTFSCTETPYSIRQNPEKIVMYSPDVDVLWPGALIQGRSHRDGLGSLLALPINERAPLRVSIPDLPTGANFRTVENPNQATVGSAIGEMRGDATLSGLATPSSINFELKTYHSEQEFALSFGISGRYLGFQASATGDLSRNASETTVTVNFLQKMFTVTVDAPQTPDAFFSDEFTRARLDEQVALGRMGPNNVPVYVSSIVYGRMMMFSMTSTASESEIRGTIEAAYNGIGSGGSTNLSAKQKTILQNSKIAITSLGGDAEATLAMIRSGNWADYFTNDAPLSSAQPLTYTFRSLTGEVAKVTEATEYTVRECAPTTPGTFALAASPQQHTAPIPVPFSTLKGDVNGDGLEDLIWNHVSADGNELYAGFAQGDGSLVIQPAVTHDSVPPEGSWAGYEVRAADADGDGSTDLVWNLRQSGTGGVNRLYVGLSNGDGTFELLPSQLHPNQVWPEYRFLTGDVDADGDDDIVWNKVTVFGCRCRSRVYVALSNGDGTFEFLANQLHPSSSFSSSFETHVGDITGDGRADLVWNFKGSNLNRVFTATATGTPGVFSFTSGPDDSNRSGWNLYSTQLADFDGDGKEDLIWARRSGGGSRVWIGVSRGNGSFQMDQGMQDGATRGDDGPWVHLVGDVSGEGRADFIFNRLDTENQSWVGLGKSAISNGGFDFSRADQVHPAMDDWSQFRVLLADVNGDRRDDIVWLNEAASQKIYVGIAR